MNDGGATDHQEGEAMARILELTSSPPVRVTATTSPAASDAANLLDTDAVNLEMVGSSADRESRMIAPRLAWALLFCHLGGCCTQPLDSPAPIDLGAATRDLCTLGTCGARLDLRRRPDLAPATGGLCRSDCWMPPPDLQGPADLAASGGDLCFADQCSPTPDLGVPTDLVGGDLCRPDGCSPPPDLRAPIDLAIADGGFCAGTKMAGTCVAAFFAPVAACWKPSGACVAHQFPGEPGGGCGKSVYRCWPNGAKLLMDQNCSSWTHSWIGPAGNWCMALSAGGGGQTMDLGNGRAQMPLFVTRWSTSVLCNGMRYEIDCPAILDLIDPYPKCMDGRCGCRQGGTYCNLDDECCSNRCHGGICH